MKPHNGHYLLEDNIASENSEYSNLPTSAFPSASTPSSSDTKPKPKEATANRWHQMLAHASDEVIQHLPASAEGVKITDGLSVPKTNKCESCALVKAHEIISRKSDNEEQSDTPFYRISFDIIPMQPAMNKDQYISHVSCYSTDFNILYTHHLKSDASALLRKTINTIANRFNRKVVFIRSDGETSLKLSLGNSFDNLLTEFGITFESSTPNTQAQNGHAERKGAILIMKARALRIAAGLPQYLWHEIFKASAYLANRTPMKKHNWKTPYEMVIGHKPSLSHLQVYGCKAYPMNKNIPKLLRLQERAHIGHLVGYEARNIFRIWIPSQRKIIRTRDVLFNDEAMYDAHDIDLIQVIQEPMLETTYDPLNLQYYTRISEIEIDDEEEVGEDENNRLTEDNEDFSCVSEIVDYLPTPRSSEYSAGIYMPASSDLSRAPSVSPAPPTPHLQPHASAPVSSASSGPRMIGLDLDEANILPEGVGRRRAPRRQAYATALIEGARGEISTFHEAFSAFAVSGKLRSPPMQITNISSVSTSSPARLHRDTLPAEPKHYGQLASHPHAAGFHLAIQTEITSLKNKGTWREIPIEQAVQSIPIIPTMWVFKYKFDEDGYLVKYKARLCARGDLQHTQQDTYAATLAARIFRALMALVAAYDLETRQYDAVNAFANSPIDEAIYCKPPDGWAGLNVLLLLLRALYGLKQAPSLWYRQLSQVLIEFGFEPVLEVECLFLSENAHIILFFFVDDIVLIFHRLYIFEVDEFQSKLFNRFEMRCLGELEWFLGIHIARDRAKHLLSLCQESYIDKLVNKFSIDLTTKVSNPLPVSQLNKYEGRATPQEIHAYQQRVGSINFAAVISRPDIAHAASKLSEFLTNPSKFHLECADRTIQYLGQSKTLAIRFNPDPNIDPLNVTFIASSDASYADDPVTRYSSQGYGFKLFDGMIDWKASKQRTVTTSSTEAEFLAMSTTGKELIW